MREHEVPTHVQAEDKVLLWFTFPQIVAVTAVCALSYGAYRYAPMGPSSVRIALAVMLCLAGIAVVVGKIGGRRLPMVAADLLKYRLGSRRYAGTVSQLVRGEPPQQVKPDGSAEGPLKVLARSARRALRRLRRKKRREAERRNGRMPFGPRGWFARRARKGRDREEARGHRRKGGAPKNRKPKVPKGLPAALAIVLVAGAVGTAPQGALAQEYWRDEIGFEMREPVPGRRIFVEGLTVTDDRAEVSLRAATGLDLRLRAYGGPDGVRPVFSGSARLEEGEGIDYAIPLDGNSPSITVSWEDEVGEAGAVALHSDRIPFPLPSAEGGLCRVRLKSLGWSPGAVRGSVESECETSVQEAISLQTVSGHVSVIETAVLDADVTAVTGTVTVASGTSTASAAFVPNGEAPFRIDVPSGLADHPVSVTVEISGSLSIPVPPLTRLTHHSERIETRVQSVSLLRPGTTREVSKRVRVEHPDGTFSTETITATLSIPAETVQQDVTLTIVHPERVEAKTVQRQPEIRTRHESHALTSAVWSDDPYQILALPEPEPEGPPAGQSAVDDEPEFWSELFGWEWPW